MSFFKKKEDDNGVIKLLTQEKGEQEVTAWL